MAAYVIAEVEVTDPALYERYRREVPGTLAPFGGRFVVRGGAVEPLEGDWAPKRLVVLEFPDRAAAKEQLAQIEALPVVALHPTIADDYRKQVAELHTALADPEARAGAIPAIRSLIDRIILKPNPAGRGVEIEVEGRLSAIVALATGAEPTEPTITVERVKGIEPSS